jgi:hypothetical protein
MLSRFYATFWMKDSFGEVNKVSNGTIMGAEVWIAPKQFIAGQVLNGV